MEMSPEEIRKYHRKLYMRAWIQQDKLNSQLRKENNNNNNKIELQTHKIST